MVAYVTRSCAPEQMLDFESHCHSCEECLAKLAILMCVLRSPLCEEDERALVALYATGVEAAIDAHQKTEIAEVEGPMFPVNEWLRGGLAVYLLFNQQQTPSAAERVMLLERSAVADT
jgi:hypothetical protein